MTTEERASEVARSITRRSTSDGQHYLTNLGEFAAAQDAIAAAITEAVAEEREACALVAEACEPAAPSEIWRAAQAGIAEAIRARATPPEQS